MKLVKQTLPFCNHFSVFCYFPLEPDVTLGQVARMLDDACEATMALSNLERGRQKIQITHVVLVVEHRSTVV